TGEGQPESGVVDSGDDPVVEYSAPFGQRQGVSRPAWRHVCDPVGVDPLQEGNGIGAIDDDLSERAYVAQGHSLPDRPILGLEIAVGPRPPPSPDPIHARSQRSVDPIQSRAVDGRKTDS